MELSDLEKIDSSLIFYAVSAFFTVIALVYFGYEYIAHLSPFTISSILFSAFTISLLIGSTREFIGFKILSYLVSAGAYLVFYAYTAARFFSTSDQIMASLVLSAVLFTGIGYLFTNRRDLLPDKSRVYKVSAGLVILVLVLVTYNIGMVSYDYELNLENEVQINEGSNIIGESKITKTGYLPIDIDTERVTFCFGTNESNERFGASSVGGYMTGFSPETETEEVDMRISERSLEEADNLEEGEIYEIERVESCEDDLEKDIMGVAPAEAFNYPY